MVKLKNRDTDNPLTKLEEAQSTTSSEIIKEGIIKTIEKINRGRKTNLTDREVNILVKGAASGRVEKSPFIYKRLLPATWIAPSPIVFIKKDDWAEVFPKMDWLGLWDPNSELIFIPDEIEHIDHIALHEGIHSIQRSGYSKMVRFRREKEILLEGATELMAVELDGENPGFYRQEQLVIKKILEDFSVNLKDIAFLNPERLYRFLAREYFSDSEEKLSRYVKEEFKKNA